MPRYRVHKSIDLDFAHHVSGHDGACINIHGHTWKFEVALSATQLNELGFVVDFKRLKQEILAPAHLLLDHALALGESVYEAVRPQLLSIGSVLVSTREGQAGKLGYEHFPEGISFSLNGARQAICNGTKIAIFPFNPTSERLAEWLHGLAVQRMADERVGVDYARVYETLHPVESVATYGLG